MHFYTNPDNSFYSKTGQNDRTQVLQSPITWKLSVHPLEQVALPKSVTEKKGKKYLTYIQQEEKHWEQTDPFNIEEDNALKNYFKTTEVEEEPEEKKKEQIYNPPVEENFEFIDKKQRKGFSYAKFIKNQLDNNNPNRKTKTIPKREDLSLIRVLTSMPNFKLQKLYQMKIQTTRNVLNLKKPTSNKFITPRFRKDQMKRRLPDEIEAGKQTEPDYKENSDNESEIVAESENSSNSFSSRFLHYRVKNSIELNQTLHSRIQTVQKKQGNEKPKLIVLTDRNRRNLFKVSDKLQYQFGVKSRPLGKNFEDESDMKEIFAKQNKKNNFFEFQEYFYQNYQVDNKGMQTTMSMPVQERNELFEQNIKKAIENLEKKKKLPQIV